MPFSSSTGSMIVSPAALEAGDVVIDLESSDRIPKKIRRISIVNDNSEFDYEYEVVFRDGQVECYRYDDVRFEILSLA